MAVLSKISSKIAKFHLQIVENRLQFRSKISPGVAPAGHRRLADELELVVGNREVPIVSADEDRIAIEAREEVVLDGDGLRPHERDRPLLLQRPVAAARQAVRLEVAVARVADREPVDRDVVRCQVGPSF